MSSSKGKKKGVEWLFGTVQGKTIISYCNGVGAAIVIVGAMFKIMHWPGASAMLIIGLSTEALLFLMGAMEPQHLDNDWSLVYPELIHHEEEDHASEEIEEHAHSHEAHKSHEKSKGATELLDNMFKDAKIEPELIASLGEGLRSLSDQTNKLNNITDASVATGDYINNIKSASSSMEKLSETYVRASESLTGLSITNKDGASYGEQLQNVAKKLSELNDVYDLQLRGSSEHLKATSQFYNGIGELMQNLNDSVEDTRKYKENIGELSKNLSALNTVYGNMLNAMNVNKG